MDFYAVFGSLLVRHYMVTSTKVVRASVFRSVDLGFIYYENDENCGHVFSQRIAELNSI